MDFKTKEIRYFFVSNIVISLVLGALLYYVLFPGVIFVKQIENIVGVGVHWNIPNENIAVRFIRNYALDMLWGYALVFSLFFIHGNNAAKANKMLVSAFAFSAFLEILQLTSFSRGTFDVFDIIVEFLAELIAAFIIKHKIKEKNDEK